MRPLEGITVLDFGTLLPGPLATLMLAEAGAQVIKIERPGRGDEMRSYTPKFGADSVNFAMLNRGKRSLTVDLKADDALEVLTPLILQADVLLEQFRPGVMGKLGFGYDAIKEINPGLIYVSITGYGQSGPLAQVAAHDLNYCAQTGMLSLASDGEGSPPMPGALVADIAGGAYPAVLNILFALRARDKNGEGCYLDISMSDNLFPFMYWAMGNGAAAQQWPAPGGELVTGGSPRYNIYRTADDRFIAAAPLEEKFWMRFCELIGLQENYRDDSIDPKSVIESVAALIRERTGQEWREIFGSQDICCNLVETVQDALQNPHFAQRKLFDSAIVAGDRTMPALPVPVDSQFRGTEGDTSYPSLGEANESLLRR
jgi:alpha-methylacyl-CoA racemase